MRFMMMVIPKRLRVCGTGCRSHGNGGEDYGVQQRAAEGRSAARAGWPVCSPAGARISCADGKPTVTDGPFAEAKDVIGGYWIIRVRSREEASNGPSVLRCPTTR